MIEYGVSAVMSIVRFVLILGIMIFMHELGHFIVAKLTGIYVHRFSLGFGPRLLGFPIGETDYCVSAIPFGGYVRMAGQYDMPAEKDSDGVEMIEEWEKNVSDERRFTSKTVPQRIALAFAGPFMNLVLGNPFHEPKACFVDVGLMLSTPCYDAPDPHRLLALLDLQVHDFAAVHGIVAMNAQATAGDVVD